MSSSIVHNSNLQAKKKAYCTSRCLPTPKVVVIVITIHLASSSLTQHSHRCIVALNTSRKQSIGSDVDMVQKRFIETSVCNKGNNKLFDHVIIRYWLSENWTMCWISTATTARRSAFFRSSNTIIIIWQSQFNQQHECRVDNEKESATTDVHTTPRPPSFGLG